MRILYACKSLIIAYFVLCRMFHLTSQGRLAQLGTTSRHNL
jgi:hypothetical protein